MSFVDWVARKLLAPMRKANLLGQGRFFDPDLLAITHELRESFPQVQAELLEILKRRDDFAPFQDISPHQTFISSDDKWKMFFLKGLGHVFKRNADQAPVTMGIINRHPYVLSAYLSVLGPRKILNPHHGPTSAILRYHLGIDIPPGKLCTLVVEGEEYQWENGGFVLFDDTFEHFAVNESDQPRAILFMDVLRPMTQFWSAIAKVMIWITRLLPYFKEPVRRHQIWERGFYTD